MVGVEPPCRRHLRPGHRPPGRAGAHGAGSLGPALAVTLHRTRRVPLRAGRSRGLALRAVRFLEGFVFRTILQHYIFVVLVFSFGIFEWLVRTGRLRSARSALVFPLLAAVGAGLLLAHSHSLENLKTVYLVEITHLPLASSDAAWDGRDGSSCGCRRRTIARWVAS